MASFNKVILMGNLTRDPELRSTPQGTPVAIFTLASNRRYPKGGEQREETLFIDVETFGRQAENVAKILRKGALVLVEGRLRQDRFDSKDGVRKNIVKFKVVAQNVQFMPRSGSRPTEGPEGLEAAVEEPVSDGEPAAEPLESAGPPPEEY